MNWTAYIGSMQYFGLAGFVASLTSLSGVEQDVGLLLDRSFWGMFGGAAVGLVFGFLLAWIMQDGEPAEEPGPAS